MKSIKTILENKKFYKFYFLLLFATIGLAYLKYPLTGSAVMNGDGISVLLFRKWFYAQFANGQLPLWCYADAAGVPISSQMVGAFFSITTLLAAFPLQWYAWLDYVFFVALGSCYFAKYLEASGIQRWISACMGVILLFAVCMGGTRKTHIMIIECTAMIPIAFYFFQCYINDQNRKHIIWAGIVCGSMLLITTPAIQYVIYLLPILLAYVLTECIYKKVLALKLITDATLFLLIVFAISAVQTLPGYELMTRYQSISQSESYPMSSFQSYSTHPIKLLFTFFPNFFSNQYMPLGIYKSSEMDIELFVGVAAASIGLFGILRYWKDRKIRLFTCVMSAVFIYAAHTNIPYLSRILYRIPLLNSVRCPSRALFMFTFSYYTIIAITFSKLLIDEKGLRQLKRYLCFLAMAIVMIVALSYFSPLIEGVRQTGELNPNWKHVMLRSLVPVLLEILALIILEASKKRRLLSAKQIFTVFVCLITVSSVCETWKYATVDVSQSIAQLSKPTEIISALQNDIGNAKTITTYNHVDGGNYSYTASYNAQLANGIPSLNCYLTYNNPYLYQLMSNSADSSIPYYNYSGLFTGYPNILPLLVKNDVLSMLGVRYIENRTGLQMDRFPTVDQSYSLGQQVEERELQDMCLQACTTEYSVASQPIAIENNAFYRIDMIVKTDTAPQTFYLDLYGSDFDKSKFDFHFSLSSGEKNYSTIFNTNEDVIPQDLTIRAVSENAADITISGLKLYKLPQNEGIYIPYRHDISNLFYENPLAKDIFYTVDFVKNVENQQELCLHPETYRYRDTCYLEGVVDQDLSNTNTKISNATWVANNEIKVDVSSDKASFVAFSQCYDPNWRVYIDGKRVENHQTNLAIQGVFFEAGEHVIVYKYVPTIVYVSLAISTITFLACIMYLILDSKKSRENGLCNTDDKRGKSIRA